MEDMKTKIAKLPKWAQRHIHVLELNMSALERATAQIFAPVEGEVQVMLPHFHGMDKDQPLPKNQAVQFFTEEHTGRWDGYVEARINHTTGLVEIRGADRILIEPQASNIFSVRLKKRGE